MKGFSESRPSTARQLQLNSSLLYIFDVCEPFLHGTVGVGVREGTGGRSRHHFEELRGHARGPVLHARLAEGPLLRSREVRLDVGVILICRLICTSVHRYTHTFIHGQQKEKMAGKKVTAVIAATAAA